MAKLTLLSLILLLFICSILDTAEPTAVRKSPTPARSYIEASCRVTQYPGLCIQYLSTFSNSTIQSPRGLAQAALKASLYRACYTKSYMKKVEKELRLTKAKEYQVVKDCLDQINDSVQQLSQSILELRRMGSQETTVGGGAGADDISWHISNVETWTSSALSDASFCLNEFPSGGKRMSRLKAMIISRVTNVAQATSNALTLFHWYAARYKATTGATDYKP